jgi:hypothetical protein
MAFLGLSDSAIRSVRIDHSLYSLATTMTIQVKPEFSYLSR